MGFLSKLQDLLNFDDPLNIEAAELYLKDKEAFQSRVREYVIQYAKRWDNITYYSKFFRFLTVDCWHLT